MSEEQTNHNITPEEVWEGLGRLVEGFDEVSSYFTDDHENLEREQFIFQKGIENGYRIMQPVRLGVTDLEHVEALLNYMEPPEGARILDVGCGIGEVAKVMQDIREDLSFVLVDKDKDKLALAPEDMEKYDKYYGSSLIFDLEDKLPFDIVMANFVAGYDSLDRLMCVAARVLKPGGQLFVYDMMTDSIERQLVILASLKYKMRSMVEWNVAAKAYGLELREFEIPQQHEVHQYVQDLFGGIEGFAQTFWDTMPAVIQIYKPEEKTDD